MIENEIDYDEHMPRIFHPNDYALSDLACRAAVSIDCFLKNIPSALLNDSKPVIWLGKILYMSTEGRADHPNGKDHIPAKDDYELNLFLTDLLEDFTNRRYRNIEEMVCSAREIALDILKIKEQPEEKQRQLREFCLELSKRSRLYWHSKNPGGFKRYIAQFFTNLGL